MNNIKAGLDNTAALRIFDLITAMRPKQWTKNGFVFAGLIFSRSFFDIDSILRVITSFFLFSFVSGSLYIVNDVIDKDKDRLHPVKCKRPIASGRLPIAGAIIFAFTVIIISLTASFLLDVRLFTILVAYSLLVFAYSIKLKNIVLLDVIIISFGFVLRTAGGAAVINVALSPWLILCTTLLALFLGLTKRRNELRVLADEASSHREILDQYTPELLERLLSMAASSTLMSYCLYTFTAAKSNYMMFTIPLVLYGIFRYQYLASTMEMGGSPELVLLHDKPLLLDIMIWGLMCIIIVGFI